LLRRSFSEGGSENKAKTPKEPLPCFPHPNGYSIFENALMGKLIWATIPEEKVFCLLKNFPEERLFFS
jgi:hypothetical protein